MMSYLLMGRHFEEKDIKYKLKTIQFFYFALKNHLVFSYKKIIFHLLQD